MNPNPYYRAHAHQPESTWFTVDRMRSIAITIISLDLFLLVLWFAGTIYIIVELDVALCFNDQFVLHFLILIHFALGMCIANLYDSATREQDEFRERGQQLIKLPFHYYQPLTWIFTAIISFTGDLVLLVAGIRNYIIVSNDEVGDMCRNARISHIAFDAVALLVSCLTVLWFIAFASYTIDHCRDFPATMSRPIGPSPGKGRRRRDVS